MDLYRTEGLLDIKRIRDKKLLFIGLGSLGSLTVANLAYPFGQIVLVDPDDLSRENVERHLLGMDQVGKPKVVGVKQWLVNRGIQEERVIALQRTSEDVLENHTNADLMVVSIDKRRSQDHVNAFCVEHNTPALYGGIYPKGTGGQVVVVPLPNDACYLCSEHIMGGNTKEAPKEVNYGVDIAQLTDDSGDLKSVPALRRSVSAVADDLAGFVPAIINNDTIAPQILVRSFDSFEPVLILKNMQALELLNYYIGYMPKLGLVPNMRISGLGDGEFEVSIRNTSLSIALRRWKKCHFHSNFVSFDNI